MLLFVDLIIFVVACDTVDIGLCIYVMFIP